MQNILLSWVESNKEQLALYGFRVKPNGAPQISSTSVDIDSNTFVGTITYWPQDQFEFQFNSCATGEIVILETTTIGTEHALNKYVREELLPKLAASNRGTKGKG
ncbi:hypothetical protein [Dokdonella soli]|uniref:Uncharacterized protein n=1 Tax=Dokdonella soli TaxID=529810 RepID=A0ABN1IPL0_9GAMM